jgi:hypothetical protein
MLDRNHTTLSPETQKDLRAMSRTLKVRMHQLDKDLKERMKAFETLKMSYQIDTAGLTEQLKNVRLSLDTANFSIRGLDSTIKFFNFNGDGGLGMIFLSDSGHGVHPHCMIRIEKDSSEEQDGNKLTRRKTIIVRSGDSTILNQTMIINTSEDDSEDLNDLDDMDAAATPDDTTGPSMVIVNNDTTLLGNDKGHRMVRITTTMDSTNGMGSVIISRQSTGEDGKGIVYKNVVISQGRGSRIKGTGSDAQAAAATSNVVIISTTKGKISRRQRPQQKVAAAADKPSSTARANVAGYALEKAAPNPAKDFATINYTIGAPGHTTLTLYDATGKVVKVVKDEDLAPGMYADQVDVSGLANGLYLYQLVSGNYSESNTLTVAK